MYLNDYEQLHAAISKNESTVETCSIISVACPFHFELSRLLGNSAQRLGEINSPLMSFLEKMILSRLKLIDFAICTFIKLTDTLSVGVANNL